MKAETYLARLHKLQRQIILRWIVGSTEKTAHYYLIHTPDFIIEV